jgi:hypothetical protein
MNIPVKPIVAAEHPDALRTLIGYVLSSPVTYANLQAILDHVVDEAAQVVLARIAAEDGGQS